MTLTTSRRSLFGVAAMLPLGALPATLQRAGPDTDLLRLCAEFHRHHAATTAAPDDAALAAVLRRRWDVSDRIEGMRPSTDAGRRAKAAIALTLIEENMGGDPASADARFAVATLRDLVGDVAPVLDTASKPDADLIKLCDAFVARDAAWCELVNSLGDLEGTPEGDVIEERISAAGAGQCERRSKIAEMTARTPAGWLAKARVQLQDWANDPPPDVEVAYSLMRDLVGSAGA